MNNAGKDVISRGLLRLGNGGGVVTKILYEAYTKKSTEKSVMSELQDRTEIYISKPEEAELDVDFPKRFKITITVEDISV